MQPQEHLLDVLVFKGRFTPSEVRPGLTEFLQHYSTPPSRTLRPELPPEAWLPKDLR